MKRVETLKGECTFKGLETEEQTPLSHSHNSILHCLIGRKITLFLILTPTLTLFLTLILTLTPTLTAVRFMHEASEVEGGGVLLGFVQEHAPTRLKCVYSVHYQLQILPLLGLSAVWDVYLVDTTWRQLRLPRCHQYCCIHQPGKGT